MANILIKVGQSFNVPIHIYEADTEEDMNTIDLQSIPMGSKCHIINNGKWYMLNSDGKWKAMPKQVQPDWNQNDDTAADYVKNRPFYSETKTVTVENATDVVLDGFPVFAIGDTITVNVDGVEHSLVAYNDEGIVTIGDTLSSLDNGEGQLGWQIWVNGEVVVFSAKEAHTVSYLGIDYHHKIDPKYLPDIDNPLNITGATVSQIAKITAVDDSGKPTAWESADLPNNEKFIITFSGNDSSYVCDKTMNEIIDAYENGQDISARFTGISPDSHTNYTNLLLSLTTYAPYEVIEFQSDIEINRLLTINAYIDGSGYCGISEYTALDNSLTDNSAAANAKAVGDALAMKQDTLIQSGATVDQIAKITAVDDTGKPTAWEAVDMPSGGGGGHWETVLDTVWEQDVIHPTAFDSETGIFTCAEGELNNLELNKEYVFFQQCTKEGAAYNTILGNEVLKVTKLSDTTFSIDVTPPNTFVPTNVKFSKGACLAITDIDAKKIRLTLDGQFHATATLYDKPFFGAEVPYFGRNTGYTQIKNAYQAYQQVTAEVESPYRIVGKILCGFNAPSNVANFHFKNNSFCCPLVPYVVSEGTTRTYFLTSDGTKIAKLYSTISPWQIGTSVENTAIVSDYLKIISGTKVKLERWVE